MADEKTTIQLDKETAQMLQEIAQALVRSKAGQIRYWVLREYNELKQCKLLPSQQESLRARTPLEETPTL